MTSFAKKVLATVRRIPRGKTLTYGEVARKAGSPRAYRAVGNVLNRYDSKTIRVPCHRVVRSDGGIGGYRWGKRKKLLLLEREARAA
ncbi:MGMT family protein [Candidatus Parcubacteria bacterium]|nr:MAG: MGMT family protein [Candidatus Parcubacteria bacterium]